MQRAPHQASTKGPIVNKLLLGYSPEFDLFGDAPNLPRMPAGASRRAVLFDTETTGHAADLLNPPRGASLAATLDRLVHSTADRAGGRIAPPVRTQLVALLHGAARQALPVVNAVLGVPQPALAKRMGRFFGVELEGLSPEDQEFEAARRFAQLAQQAARAAVAAPAQLPPAAAARWAAERAARRYAPGWWPALRTTDATRSGRWVRHGSTVSVFDP